MIDWTNVLNEMANSILPELAKVVFYTIIVPLIAILGNAINRKITESHFGFIVKYIAQKIPKTLENWQEKRMSEAIGEARKHWYLKWLSEETIKGYVEVAVRTYRDNLLASGIDSQKS